MALTEIHYPHSWNNIQQFRFYVRNEKLDGVWDSLGMLPGHCSSVEDVLQKMKELVDNENRYTDDVRFSYDNLSNVDAYQRRDNNSDTAGKVENETRQQMNNLFQRLCSVRSFLLSRKLF